MPPIVRFAPSPTGRLHIGNIRTALINWLFARKSDGRFLLRLDDTDQERSKEEFAVAIREDLTWLGLTWDQEERQSARTARYDAAAAALKVSGRLYPCFETEGELDRKRKRQLARGMPPIYDRSALKLIDAERSKLEATAGPPHWRFKLDTVEGGAHDGVSQQAHWLDLIRGDQSIDMASLSDPVLIRAGGTYLYTFTSVVDDIDLAITHIIRGEDHVTNTGVQIQLFEAMGAEPPRFAHHSLLIGADGHALSKRLGSLSIASFREAGLEPMAVASHAALIGTSQSVAPYRTLTELVELFEIAKLSRSPTRFDPTELAAINAKLLHETPYGDVSARLAGLGIESGEDFWTAVRGNIEMLAGVEVWWRVVAGPITPVIEDAGFCQTAAGLLPAEPWDERTWSIWTEAVKTASGVKGRALFHPLRLALTGTDKGPELKTLLPLIGRAKAVERLKGKAA